MTTALAAQHTNVHDACMGLRINSAKGMRRDPNASTTVTGRIGVTIFGLIFAGMGLLFTSFLLYELAQQLDRYTSWPPTQATITDTQIEIVDDDENPYQLTVGFTYSYEQQKYTATGPAVDDQRYDDYDKAEDRMANYPVGAEVTAYVNPEDPSEAALERGSFWIALFIPLPLIFVAVGSFIIYSAWKKGDRQHQARRRRFNSRLKNSNLRYILLYGFFAIFLGVGVFVLPLAITPWTEYLGSDAWVATPCVIERSAVQSHSSDDGTTYSVDILFRYEFDGETHRSNRYSFAGGSSSGYAGKRAVTEQYPVGSEATCYVNPDAPGRTVLNRDFSAMMLLPLLLLLFPITGLSGIVGTGIYHRRALHKGLVHARISGTNDRHVAAEHLDWLPEFRDAGPMQLKPKINPWLKAMGVLLFALFWNGVVSIFVFNVVVPSHLEGDPDWFITLFMIPFIAVGVGSIGAFFWYVLAAFNPRIILTVSNDALRPGDQLGLTWEIAKRAERITKMTITLVAEEQATYRRGTNTTTDKEQVCTLPIAATTDPSEIAAGSGSCVLPTQVMHSFESSNNKVIWKLIVHGEIHFWPDVKNDYHLVVLPANWDIGGKP